jgi:hypothetical protein
VDEGEVCKGVGEAGKVKVVEGREAITGYRKEIEATPLVLTQKKEIEATPLVLTLDMSMEVCMPNRALYIFLKEPP